MAERNPKDINKKLKNLTAAQAKELAKGLNSVYTDAENTKKPAQKKQKPKN